PTRRARPDVELLLRRGRRGHVLRRETVYAGQGSAGGAERAARPFRGGGPPRGFPPDPPPPPGPPPRPKLCVPAARAVGAGAGVAYIFGDAVIDLAVDGGGRVAGVRTAAGRELSADAVVLAVGHSSRAMYERLHALGVALEPRPFAVGARVEHPQPLIDRIQ